MVWLRLLGGLGSLLVAGLVVGSLSTMGLGLVGNSAATVVVGLLVLVVLTLALYGRQFGERTPYW